MKQNSVSLDTSRPRSSEVRFSKDMVNTIWPLRIGCTFMMSILMIAWLLLAIARAHYLAGRYSEALGWIDRVLLIDPEDIGALYNRMLSLGALGRTDELAEAQRVYEFYKETKKNWL